MEIQKFEYLETWLFNEFYAIPKTQNLSQAFSGQLSIDDSRSFQAKAQSMPNKGAIFLLGRIISERGE
jgi:hypothetical protein